MLRNRIRLSAALIIGSATVSIARAQEFHPSMVEVGVVGDGQHVKFAPPFPSTPKVVIAAAMTEKPIYVKCHPAADNVTPTGFDYHSNCNYDYQIDASWIATLQR